MKNNKNFADLPNGWSRNQPHWGLHVTLGASFISVSDCRACHIHAQRQCCVNSKCTIPTCAPLGALVLKWGVVRRTDGGLLSRGSRKQQRHGPTTNWCKVKIAVCFLLCKGRIRCAYTGGFTSFMHSDVMIERLHSVILNISMNTIMYCNKQYKLSKEHESGILNNCEVYQLVFKHKRAC